MFEVSGELTLWFKMWMHHSYPFPKSQVDVNKYLIIVLEKIYILDYIYILTKLIQLWLLCWNLNMGPLMLAQ